LSRRELDIADADAISRLLQDTRPWAVINAAGYVRVAEAEREPDLCFRENVLGAETLARACAEHGIPLVTFASDLVFDGAHGPYVESDPVNPATAYGCAKAEAERRVLAAHDRALVVRTSAFFGPWDRHNFAYAALATLAAGRSFAASHDLVSPTYVPDLAHVTLDLLIDGAAGVWHLASPGEISWSDFARVLAGRAGYDPALVVAPRNPELPRNAALASERGLLLPPLETTFDRFLRDAEVDWAAGAMRSIAAE